MFKSETLVVVRLKVIVVFMLTAVCEARCGGRGWLTSVGKRRRACRRYVPSCETGISFGSGER